MADIKQELIYDDISDKIIKITERLATKDGAHTVTVKKIINELNCTNRVFYNRFHNVDEVLQIVYKSAVIKMHESIKSEYDKEKDFFEYVTDVATKVLINTYDIKMKFSQYMFEHDSLTESNRIWWTNEIKKFLEYAQAKGFIKKVDHDVLCYSIWCFCRGYNADAVSRKLSKEDAIKYFKFGFGCFLEGIKIK